MKNSSLIFESLTKFAYLIGIGNSSSSGLFWNLAQIMLTNGFIVKYKPVHETL